MEFTLWFLVLTVLCKTSSCIRCFKCLPEDTFYDSSKLLCQHFDGSEKYEVDCEKSTMCFKRVTTLNFGNGVTSVSVHRDCASQSLGKEQVKVNGKWQRKTIVHDDVYEEACIEDRSDSERTTTTLNCHCRGDRCNGSITNKVALKTISVPLFIYLLYFS